MAVEGPIAALDQMQDVGEQASWDCDHGKLERDIAIVANARGAEVHHLLPQRGERSVLDHVGYGQWPLMVTNRVPGRTYRTSAVCGNAVLVH